ncbi:hypothetical protein [Rubrivirga sp.]|uniref:hypothetical protein n=1 Tax=Rubrivirga sp. TaxID=1885344 RepID=UPI003B53024E
MDRRQFLQVSGAGTVGLAGGASAPARAAVAPLSAPADLKHWTWVRGTRLDAEWRQLFGQFRDVGITAALIDVDAEALAAVVPIAAESGIEVHAWMITMMEGGFEDEHPEWYAVNRDGESTATDPPYVDYYKFMCPSREPVRRHKEARARRLAGIEGIAGLHLDYIRVPDVILPSALWPTYGIVQDREYAPYDYCYCEVCRGRFEARTGIDPLALEDPSQNRAWVQYRYDTITEVVHGLSQVARAAGVPITAAVFPSPSIARTLVRQDWPRWPLDAVLPMVYNWFYEEGTDWIEPTVREGVTDLGGRFPLYAGLYVAELTPDQLAEAARRALAGGARGVVVFEGAGTSPEHWAALGAVLRA